VFISICAAPRVDTSPRGVGAHGGSIHSRAVTAYTPKVSGRIDDLTVSAGAILQQFPDVANVERLVTVVNRAQATDPETRVCKHCKALKAGLKAIGR
jgi:hypothetical protein